MPFFIRAVKIQVVWRGHKGRKNAFRIRINHSLRAEYTRYTKALKAAINIQVDLLSNNKNILYF